VASDDNPPGDPAGQQSQQSQQSQQATVREARALAHPARIRILRLCLDRALTNAELATALGQRPATVLHHVRTLVSAGFLTEDGWRRGPRGSTEKPYRATGKSWQLQGTLSTDDGTIWRSVFQAVAAEIAEAGPGAVVEGARVALRLQPDQLDSLVTRLRDMLAEFPPPERHLADEPPPGDPYAMLFVLHRRQLPKIAQEG
jgi:DNA-binding transcriptional ArsR family regulator